MRALHYTICKYFFCIPVMDLAGKYFCSGQFDSIGNQLTVDSYSIHVSTTHQASLSISFNVLLTKLIQGGERLQIFAGIFVSLLPAGQITDKEAAATIPIVLLDQSGLRNFNGRPILKTPSPSGGGTSRITGLKTLQALISISVSISKNCCSFSLYLMHL